MVTGSLQGGAKGQALPARVVDARPFDQGDVALLKVETTDLPSVELATDADVQIGTPLLSIGYPASADAVTDPTLEPTNKDGQVSSKKTVGSVPVHETSAALTPGMSGGPTVDLDGRVLGVNSFMPSGESQAFNFIAPSSGLSELLSRNGVHNELGADDKAFRAALDDYYAGHYTAAIAGFDKLLQVAPQHAQATQFRTLAAKARDRFGDTPVAPAPAPSSGLPLDLSPPAFWSIVGGGSAGSHTLDGAADRAGAPSGQRAGRRVAASGPSAHALPRLRRGSRAGPRARTGLARHRPPGRDRRPQHPERPGERSTPAPAAVLTAPREDCTRCGTRLAAEAHFCSTCGLPRS